MADDPGSVADAVWEQRAEILLILGFINYLHDQGIHLATNCGGALVDLSTLLVGYFDITPAQWQQLSVYLTRNQP